MTLSEEEDEEKTLFLKLKVFLISSKFTHFKSTIKKFAYILSHITLPKNIQFEI